MYQEKFKGKPLVEIPKVVPMVDFLVGDFGKEILKEYSNIVKEDFNNNSNLRKLSYEDNVVKGSNPFAVVLVNQIISQEGLRTADPKDLERILRTNTLDLTGKYEDSALVLRSEDNPNKYLAVDLAKQIKSRNKTIKYPIMIPLTSLELVKDDNSNYGLSFKLKENAELIYAPILDNKEGNFTNKDIDEETGLPKEVGKEGNRHLYLRKDGLSRLCLGWNLGLVARSEYLSDSYSGGRVVVVSGNATEQNFVDEINKEYQKQEIDLKKRKEKALQILKGN